MASICVVSSTDTGSTQSKISLRGRPSRIRPAWSRTIGAMFAKWVEAYRGERLAKAGEALGITVEAIARGRDGRFVPAGNCWVVERSFAWLTCYRRLNTIFERTKEHLVAFVGIAFISIFSRRLNRLVANESRA
jgi:Transposase DDE domain